MGRRFRRIFYTTATIIVAILVLTTAMGAYLLRTEPSWYRKLALSPDEQAAAERRLLDRLATLRNNVGLVQANARHATQPTDWPTFDFELTEDEVNGPLARWTEGGPVTQWAASNPDAKSIFAEIQEPHVRFLDGRIELVGRSTSLSSLVSVELTVEQPTTEDGFPTVTLGRPWAGRIPLSRSLIEGPALKGLDQLREEPETKVPHAVIDAAEQLIRGEPTTPIVVLTSSTTGTGLIAARVERLEITDGKLKATLRPIDPKQQKTR